VKFHWFAEVEHGGLPADFPQQHRSSWVTPPPSLADPVTVGEEYGMFIRLMQQCDALGWDGLTVNEHHQTSFAMSPSPNLLAAALAVTTENAAITLCGNSLALYNPPTRVAEEMAMLDCMSGGRLVAGMVFGTPMDTAFSLGVAPVELRERFHEARELILRAWEADEPFAFNGRYTQLRYVNVWPKTIQAKLPIWIPGSGSVETWQTVVQEDYCYGYLSFYGLNNARPIVRGFWDYAEAHGGSLSPYRLAFTQLICVADSDEEAERDYYEAVKYFFTHNPVPLEFGGPPGYHTQATLRETIARAGAGDAAGGRATRGGIERVKASRGELSFWEYDELGFIIAGTPERVEQRVRAMCEELRVGQLITALHMGNLPEETAAKNNHLFGTKVMPKLRDLWDGEEDRWTPAVSQERVAAVSAKIATEHGITAGV
jgi:alkanesulfonate monooxygenase SsuD/methylene tetrahydromethanopterin reductase-like flavin-dependent oxidoreductase (luciferase family)